MIAAGTAACGGDDGDSAPEQSASFDEGDLPSLVLAPQDAPTGTEVADAGPRFLEAEVDPGEEARELRRLRELGLAANYGIEFEPDSRDGAFVAAVALLFESAESAERALELQLESQLEELAPAEEIPAEDLGDAAFGVSGNFDGEFPTAAFGVRTGNVIQQITVFSPEGAKASIEQARELAGRLQAQAEGS